MGDSSTPAHPVACLERQPAEDAVDRPIVEKVVSNWRHEPQRGRLYSRGITTRAFRLLGRLKPHRNAWKFTSNVPARIESRDRQAGIRVLHVATRTGFDMATRINSSRFAPAPAFEAQFQARLWPATSHRVISLHRVALCAVAIDEERRPFTLASNQPVTTAEHPNNGRPHGVCHVIAMASADCLRDHCRPVHLLVQPWRVRGDPGGVFG